MTGRSGSNPPGGRPGSQQTTQFAALTASTDSHDAYWHYENSFYADDDDYDDDDDEDPTSFHIEESVASSHRQPLSNQPPPPPYGHGQPGNNVRLSITSTSPVPYAQDPMTYQSLPPENNPPPGFQRRPRIRRGVAREPRAHISPIPEDSASTAFPLTIQGPGQRIVRPLPPIPAGAGQPAQARGPVAQRVEEISELTRLLSLSEKEKEGGHGKNQKDQG